QSDRGVTVDPNAARSIAEIPKSNALRIHAASVGIIFAAHVAAVANTRGALLGLHASGVPSADEWSTVARDDSGLCLGTCGLGAIARATRRGARGAFARGGIGALDDGVARRSG